MKTYNVIHIDCTARTVQEATVSGLEDMQKLVGGLIERAHILENGDEVFVDEEGLLKGPVHFFYLEGASQPYAGNAFIIGPTTRGGNNRDVQSTVHAIKRILRWYTPSDVLRHPRGGV